MSPGIPALFNNVRKLFRLHVLQGCGKLVKADLKGLQIQFNGINGIAQSFKDCDNLEYTISKIMGIDMKDIKVVKEIEYTDGGFNVKEI